MQNKNTQYGVTDYLSKVAFVFEHLYAVRNSIPTAFNGRVPSGVNVEGAEVHGLSMGKKSSPKIDRDLREGKYLCTFTYSRRERR